MMQFLYVLVSCRNDTYYEQFLLSVTSLRLNVPNAEVILLCDSKTNETLTGMRTEYEKYITKKIIAIIPDNMRQIEISRWIKTSMRRHVKGNFLFIDCDTIITDNLIYPKENEVIFGACLDKHSLISRHAKKYSIIDNEIKLGFDSYKNDKHYNSGVIFCADTPETNRIFDRWHELWQFSNSKNIVRDQPSFNMAIYENLNNFTELDGIWNCQIAFNGLPYLANSKIIHYFASDLNMHTSPFILASKNIFKKIKETGLIPDEILHLLKNPKSAFLPESRIIAGNDMLNVINSPLLESILFSYQKTPVIYNFLNRLSMINKKIVKSLLVKKEMKKLGNNKYYN